MKVLQFAFDGDPDNPYLPAHHGEQSVVYTGTHDNDTTLGWWARSTSGPATRCASLPRSTPTSRCPGRWSGSPSPRPARLAVVPAQDLLGLGSESRMNTPGTADGNWAWQAPAGAFDDAPRRAAARAGGGDGPAALSPDLIPVP